MSRERKSKRELEEGWERDSKTNQQTERERERRHRETQRQRHRERERDTEKERQRKRERKTSSPVPCFPVHVHVGAARVCQVVGHMGVLSLQALPGLDADEPAAVKQRLGPGLRQD